MQPLNRPLQPNPLILPEPKHSLQKIFDFLSYGKAYFWGTYDQTKDVDTRYNWVIHQLKVLNKERGEASFWIKWNTQGHQVYLEIQKEIEALRPLNLRDLSSSEKDIDAIQQSVTRDQAIEHLNGIRAKEGEVRESLDKLSNESLEPSWPQWLLKHLSVIREIEEKIQSLDPLQKFFVIGERGAIEELPGVDVEDLKKHLSHTLFQMAEKHFVAFVEKDYCSYYQQVQEKIVHLQQDRASYLKKNWNYAWSFWGNYWEKEHHKDASFLRGRVDYLKTLHLATALPQLKDFRKEVNSLDDLPKQFENLFPSQAEGSITKICRIFKAFFCLSNLPSLPLPQDWEKHRHIGVGLGDTPAALAMQLLFSDPFLARFTVEGKGQTQEIKQLYKKYLSADWNCHWVSWQEFIRAPSNKDTLWLNPHASFKKREPFKLNPLQLQNFPQTAKAALEELTAHLDSQANPLFHTLVTRKLGYAEKQEAQQAIIDLEWTAPDQSQDPEETPSYRPQTLELLLEEKFCLTHPQEGKEFTQFSKFPEVLLIHLSKSSQTQKEPFGIMEHLYLNSDFSSETSSGTCYELVSFLVDKTHYRKTGFGYFSIQNDVVESVSRGIFLENAKTSTLAVFRRSSESFTAEEIYAQATQNLYRFYIDLYRPLTIEAALGRSKYTAPVNQQRGMQCLTSFVSSLVCSPSFPRKQIGLFPRNPNDFTEYTFNELPTPFQQFLWDVWKPPSQSSQQPNPSFLQDIRSKLLLQADELPLDIPPHPDEQKYDKDGFVLTLLADRLFKYLQKHPEKILHDPMQKTLYLATHHAIAQVAAARRIQKIRLSVLIEETVQITTTLALAPFTKNKKSHLRQQAISTTSRVFSIIVDPLQESPRLQKIMQMGTSVVLFGESLDDPALSEKDKDTIAALFLAKSIFSHTPGFILPPIPEKHRHLYDSTTDIALTLSTAYLKETPTPIVSWAASYTLRRLDRSLVLPLSPDTPQSTYNFYAARIISPALSNSTLHTLTAEKTLKAIQDLTKRPPSPKFSESLDPEEQAKYPKQELPEVDEPTGQEVLVILEGDGVEPGHTAIVAPPVIQMQDPEAYVRLQKEKELEVAKLPSLEKTAESDKKQYDKDHKDKVKYKEKKDDSKGPYGLIKYGNLHKKAREACDISKPKAEKSAQKLTDQKNTIADIDRKITEASAPKQIKAPDTHIHRVFEESTKKNHHVYIVDSRGDNHSLGKYSTAEDARFISGVFTGGEANKVNYNIQCYDIQQQMSNAGVPIGQIPNTPEFQTPSFSGNNVDKNHRSAQQTFFFNRDAFQDFVKDSEKIMGRPIEVQGLSRAEIHQISSQAAPNITEIPQDSLWDKTVKAPGKAYDATSKFLGKVGFSTQGGVNLVTISSPETASASGQPTLFHHNLKPASTGKPPSSYFETRHQIAMERAGLQVAEQPLKSKTNQPPAPGSQKAQWTWENTQAYHTQQTFQMNMDYQSPSSPSVSTDFAASSSTSLLSKAAPLLVGPIPAIVIKLKECFTSKETTPSFTSVSPGLLLAPQGLQRGSLTLSSIDFAVVDQTFADTGKPHLALQELGRQLTSSTEFSERTREWVGAAFKEIDQFAHHYAYENSNNPLQAKIDTVGGIIHGGCSLGKDLVTLQVQLSLGPFLKPHEMQTVLQHIDNASTTVGAHYTQTIQTINPRFNSNSAAYKVGHFTGKYILPTIGPGVVRARPPNPTYLTTKAAQMLETLEARLAARSEAFFPELRPALPTGPRSLPTPRLPSTTKPPASLSRTGASKPPISTEPTNLSSGKKVEASKLAERNVSKIRTDWVFPKKGGAMINGRWYTEHALERMAPRTPEVMAELEVRALNRAAAEGIKPQTKDFKDFWLKHRPDPRNIPPSVVEAEIANPGSTSIRVELNNRGDIITVMPGGKR